MKSIKTSDGWEIWDGVAFEPDSRIFQTKQDADNAAECANDYLPAHDESKSAISGDNY